MKNYGQGTCHRAPAVGAKLINLFASMVLAAAPHTGAADVSSILSSGDTVARMALPDTPQADQRVPGDVQQPVEWAQLAEQRIIMRIPMRRPGAEPRRPDMLPPEQWKESKGPKCIPLRDLAGAALSPATGLDFVVRKQGRLRVKLERGCSIADLYSGFYVKPEPDGVLCADRDEVLTRNGMRCEVRAFRKLEPKRR